MLLHTGTERLVMGTHHTFAVMQIGTVKQWLWLRKEIRDLILSPPPRTSRTFRQGWAQCTPLTTIECLPYWSTACRTPTCGHPTTNRTQRLNQQQLIHCWECQLCLIGSQESSYIMSMPVPPNHQTRTRKAFQQHPCHCQAGLSPIGTHTHTLSSYPFPLFFFRVSASDF